MRGKIVAILIFIVMCMMFCSCSSNEPGFADSKIENSDAISASTFPLKENGYPDVDYITVNGESYKTQVRNRDTNPEEVIEVSVEDKSNNVIIVLPQCVNILKWVVNDMDAGIELVENRKCLPNSNGEYNSEGDSPYLYEFVFAVTNPKQMEKVVFELVNVDNSIDPEGYYTLTIAFAD